MSAAPIIAFIGRRGSGKTLLMTIFIYKMVLANECKNIETKIYSSYNLFFDGCENVKLNYLDPDVFNKFFGENKKAFELTNAIFALDEIAMYADAYNFSSPIVKKLCKFALQSRKRNINIFYTAQYMSLVPRRLRLATEIVIEPQYDERTDTIQYIINDFDGSGFLPIETIFIKNASKYFKLYDTEEIVIDI